LDETRKRADPEAGCRSLGAMQEASTPKTSFRAAAVVLALWGALGDGFEGDRTSFFDQLADGPLGALDGVLALACRGCA
jgi:hypothetical protein